MPGETVREQGGERATQARAVAMQVGAFLWRAAKITLLMVVGLSFVAATALLISIIQFQIRIIEAKNQSKSFSLTSLTQSVEMQKEFTASVEKIQKTEAIMAKFLDIQEDYFKRTSQIATYMCASAEDKIRPTCVADVINVIQSAQKENLNQIYNVISSFIKTDRAEQLKPFASQAVELVQRRSKFNTEYEDTLVGAKFACTLIEYHVGSTEDFASALGYAPEYVTVARRRCLAFQTGGALLGQDATKQGVAGPIESDLAGALFFDVTAYYRFYENMFNGLLSPFVSASKEAGNQRKSESIGSYITEQIVIAPIDISFVLLVVTCGALGAMLRISAETYNPALFRPKDANEAEVAESQPKTWVYYFVVGIMCSLIIYILARTVFAGLVDTTYVAKSGNMSPFVIAFMAIVSGLMCEEAFQQIIRAGKATLARSTGGEASTGGGNNNKQS